jgi:hypothetical protein
MCRPPCASRSAAAMRTRRTLTKSCSSISSGVKARAAHAHAPPGKRSAKPALLAWRFDASHFSGERCACGWVQQQSADPADGCCGHAHFLYARAARYKLDNLNKEYNQLNKAVAKLKIVRPACLRRQRGGSISHVRFTCACASLPGQRGCDEGDRGVRGDGQAARACRGAWRVLCASACLRVC